MQFTELLESVGFPNRKQGDEFYNPKDENDKVTFQQLILWPDGPGVVAFDSPEQRDERLNAFVKEVQGKVFMLNKPNRSTLGLYIVHMVNASGEDEYYVKYIKSVGMVDRLLTSIPPNIKDGGHGGYKYGSKTARKEAYPIKPSNIFKTDFYCIMI